MFAAFLILIVLILASPLATLVDGNVMVGIEASMMALATALVAGKSGPAQAKSWPELSGVAVVVPLIPALWMMIQVLPLGYLGIANPVWQTTQQALGHAVVGSIAIDTGAGILGVIQYIAALAILVVTMAVALERSKADRLLFALMVATTIICLPIAELWSRLVVRNVGVLGVLLAVTAAIRAFERSQSSPTYSQSKLLLSVFVSIACVGICGSALAMHWTGNVGFSLAFALTVVLSVAFTRRLAIGNWGATAIAAIMLTVAIAIVSIRYGGRALDVMTAFSDDEALAAITRPILADAPWYGSGPRSFETLVNLYQQPADLMRVTTAATAAAKIAIELGRPMLWILSGVTLLVIGALVRGALRRGRDSFYPALGAGSVIALLIASFANAGVFTPAVSIVAAAIVGLGLAQSSGRTPR